MNKEELKELIKKDLGCRDEDLIWSSQAANYKTLYKDTSKGTVSFKKVG